MKKLRIISLIVLIITAVISVDLMFNWLGNLNPEIHDGLGMHTVIIPGNIYFGDSLWTMERFFNAFVISSIIAFAVFVENIVINIIAIIKKQ